MPVVRVAPDQLDLDALREDLARRVRDLPEPTEEQIEQWTLEDEIEAAKPLPPEGTEEIVPYTGPFLKRRPNAAE